jgi:hypothetical protein
MPMLWWYKKMLSYSISTQRRETVLKSVQEVINISRAAVDDFKRFNLTSTVLKNLFIPPAKRCFLISSADASFYMSTLESWEALFERFPRAGAITFVSRPGFDPEHEIALLSAETQSVNPFLFSEGTYYVLRETTSHGWQIENKVIAWESDFLTGEPAYQSMWSEYLEKRHTLKPQRFTETQVVPVSKATGIGAVCTGGRQSHASQ